MRPHQPQFQDLTLGGGNAGSHEYDKQHSDRTEALYKFTEGSLLIPFHTIVIHNTESRRWHYAVMESPPIPSTPSLLHPPQVTIRHTLFLSQPLLSILT